MSDERGSGCAVVIVEGSLVRGNKVSEELGRGCLMVVFTAWGGGRSGCGE